MSKKYIALIIILLLLPAFLMTGCGPASGGGNNGVLPIIVTFNPQGGEVSPASKEVTAGSNYGELPMPTKPDSTFLGWFTEKVGGTEVTSKTKVTNTKSHTLYAQWEEFVGPQKTVTVTFDPIVVDGTVSPKSKEVTVGSTYGELPVPTKTGLAFIGWFTEKIGGEEVTSSTIVTINTNHTLYAQWEPYIPKKVTVTFDTNGGTPIPLPITVTVGSTYGTLPVVKKTMFVFKGWFTKDGGEVTSSTTVTIDHDHTLEARWDKLFDPPPTVTVTFDAMGGTPTPNPKIVIVYLTYGTLPEVKKAGSIFQGWFTKKVGGNKVTEDTIVTKEYDHTLYAHWATAGPAH